MQRPAASGRRQRLSVSGSLAGASLFLVLATASPAAIQLTPVVSSGLSSPLFVGHAGDGTNRLFIVERAGTSACCSRAPRRRRVFLDIDAQGALPAASAACSGSRSTRSTRATAGSSSSTRALGRRRARDRRVRRVRPIPNVADPDETIAADDRAPGSTATTTAACSRSGPTAISTSASATAAPATIRRTTRRTSTRCSARSCASTSTRPTGVGTPYAARRQPVRRTSPGATRSSRSACAIRGASASIATPASSGWPTSARARARRSTRRS